MSRTFTREQVLTAIEVLKRVPLAEVQRLGYHFQPNDYYSPVNDLEFLARNADLWQDRAPCPAIDWNLETQLETARRVARHVGELADVPLRQPEGRVEFCWENEFWNNADALVHYGLLRELQPRRVVEIGCGWSSLLLRRALERNERPCRVTQIEPYPDRAIFATLPPDWEHLECILQRAPLEPFAALRPGDVCFYDGSHCAKAASDVNWFFFEVLPRLAPGVLIHLHDVFLPEDYPESWILERGLTWNEQYLLQAFLMGNRDYEILIANRFLWRQRGELLDELYRGVQPSYGCSFWMRRREDGGPGAGRTPPLR